MMAANPGRPVPPDAADLQLVVKTSKNALRVIHPGTQPP